MTPENNETISQESRSINLAQSNRAEAHSETEHAATANGDSENRDAVEIAYVYREKSTDKHPFGLPGQCREGRIETMPAAGCIEATGEDLKSSKIQPQSTGIFRFGELMNAKVERPKDIVKSLISERQNAILIGRFAIGKTMLGTQLSLHLASGRDFLGLTVPRKFRTMYLDFENDLGDMKDRLAKQIESLKLSEQERSVLDENWIYADAGDDENPLHGIKLDGDDRKVLEPLIEQLNNHKTEVLFIDNLGLVASNGDLTDAEETGRFYANLKHVRSKVPSLQDGAIVIFHHLTKPGEYQSSISLLTSPYEYLSRARGSGRVLDHAKSRLALAEEEIGGKKCHVLNGINRSGVVSPLILQFNPETLSFDRHEDTKLRFDAVFGNRSRGREIYMQLPEDEFRFTDAANLKDTNTGKPFNKGTLSETLRVAVANDFMTHDRRTGIYRKIFNPQSD